MGGETDIKQMTRACRMSDGGVDHGQNEERGYVCVVWWLELKVALL